MTTSLPLIRAGAVVPFLIWMRDRGVRAEAGLRAAGLPPDLIATPRRPIPLLAGIRFVVAASRAQGPDLGCRVVTDRSIRDLGLLALAMSGARTPREALARAAWAFAHHGSHEQFTLTPSAGGAVVRHLFRVPLDDEATHVCQQYVAAMVRAAAAGTGYRGARVTEVALVPHPAHGLAHVQRHFSGRVVAATGRAVEVTLPDAVLDRAFLAQPRERGRPALPDGWAAIRGDGSLAGSIRTVLPDLLAHGEVSTEALAALAFMSPRTLQRRLAAEGTHLSRLLDEARRTLALERLADGSTPIADIAVQLGYGSSPSFSRAVRRWTGEPPRQVRRGPPGHASAAAR